MNGPIKIKVCGLLNPGNIEEVCTLGPDFVGYIFYPGSKRFVGTTPDPVIFRIPQPEIAKVGVFVDEDISRVKQIYSQCQLDLVQLHGNESPQYCRILKDEGIAVIKAFKPDSVQGIRSIENYPDGMRYILFDTPGKELGGTGQKFDWDLLDGLSLPFPFLLSGGIGPEDGESIRKIEHEALFGVDVNSRFELSPGMKDIIPLEKFMKEIRA
jgi:phosphoribosylanthranilate isomerase